MFDSIRLALNPRAHRTGGWRALQSLLLALALGLCGTAGTAFAQNIETIMAPGKLAKAHARYEEDCAQCHVRFDRNAQDTRCQDCHKPVRADVQAKTGFHGKMKPQACRTCHTEHKGADAKLVVLDKAAFDHKLTDFALNGKHQKAECEKCHDAQKLYREAPSDCHACHKADDDKKGHKGSLGNKCGDCHNENGWKEAKFDHDKTRFALSGKHADAKCTDCHRNNTSFKDTPRNCYACHKKDDEQKGHKGQYGEKCESCHGAKAWKTLIFNHDLDTKYPLRGKHKTIKCADCHGSAPLYKTKTPQECYACHKKDDKHQETLGKNCSACHTEKDWKEPAKFDHDKTDFPLLGKHVNAACKACHEGVLFKQASKACFDCHKKEDKHEGTLGKACGDCHTEREWKNTSGRFDHDKTQFKLRNAHAAPAVQCKACHQDLKSMRKTSTDCYACHKADDDKKGHKGTLGKACGDCHQDSNWREARDRFDHNKTRFALRGAHAAARVACKDCHSDAQHLRDTPMACVSCHKKDDKHEGTSGTRCESCHSEANWKIARFDHNKTRMPLLGRHALVDCKDCHKTLRFRDNSSDCVSCHLKSDQHKQTLGTRCENCHNARAWSLWDFDHDLRTRYRLDGAHARVECIKCHTKPAPAGKDIAPLGAGCQACHRNKDPHEGRYGVRCEQCHVTANWKTIKGVPGAGAALLPETDRLLQALGEALAARPGRYSMLDLPRRQL